MSKTRKHRRHGAAQGRRTPQTQRRTPLAAETDSHRELRSLTRLQLRLIWEMAQLGGPLPDEHARTIQAMREHPEYADLWPRLDTVSDAELLRDGNDPILHITIHETLENQLAANDPPVTGEVLTALMSRGLARHEALHRLGAVLAEELFSMMTNRRVFDPTGFERKLRELTRGTG